MTRQIVITLSALLGGLTGCVNADDSHSNAGDKEGKSASSASETTHTVNGSIHVHAGKRRRTFPP